MIAPGTPIPSQQQKEQRSDDAEEMKGEYRFLTYRGFFLHLYTYYNTYMEN